MRNFKKYYEYLDELSEKRLYEGLLGYGLFSDKIPNFLSTKSFYKFCSLQEPKFEQKHFKHIEYESMRNINVPRIISIPNPLAYYKHCKVLYESWSELKGYFKNKTKEQNYKVSRIHIRKIKHKKKIFKNEYKEIFRMNSNDYKEDGAPEQKIFIGKKYKVEADISNCFPSIYTHSICWALVGIDTAKENVNNAEWYNKIDNSIQWLNYNETHGIFIGPHSSNLISEIILVAVDEKLKKYEYVRNIDDYICFTETKEKAEQFLIDLSQSLKEFRLSLNHKKTKITELPTSFSKEWINKLKMFQFIDGNCANNYPIIVAFMDLALKLMQENQNNAAILNYAIKMVLKRKMTKNAKDFFVDTIHHLVLLYPYLISTLEFIFDKYIIKKAKIQKILSDIFKLGYEKQLYEPMIYALYYSLKYNLDFKINEYENSKKQYLLDIQPITKNDCILLLLSYLFDKKNKQDINPYIDLAKAYIIKEVKTGQYIIDDEYWLFAYEVLRIEKPNYLDKCKDWKQLKDKEISFIQSKFLKSVSNKFSN